MKHFYRLIINFILIFFISCAATDNSNYNISNFKIDYSVGGGFTGLMKGITISPDGTVEFWQKSGTGSLPGKDSIKLDKKKLELFTRLLQDTSIFSYKINNTGNITSTITLQSENLSNIISFEGTNPPPGMPDKLVELISEIKKLYLLKKD